MRVFNLLQTYTSRSLLADTSGSGSGSVHCRDHFWPVLNLETFCKVTTVKVKLHAAITEHYHRYDVQPRSPVYSLRTKTHYLRHSYCLHEQFVDSLHFLPDPAVTPWRLNLQTFLQGCMRVELEKEH